MNRLVIVGNGFDLAHGLPTGYCDFIDAYWTNVINRFENLRYEFFEDNLIEIKLQFKISSRIKSKVDFKNVLKYNDLENFVEKYTESYNPIFDEQNFDRCSLKFHNSFFKLICSKRSIQNWVDIENEYYRLLKNCLKEDDNSKVKKLNQEFEQVKILLEKYLHDEVSNKTDFENINTEIKDIFNIWTRFTDRKSFQEEFSKDEKQEVSDYSTKLQIYNNNGADDLSKYIKRQGLEVENVFLNFNYTPTVNAYISSLFNDDMNYYGNSTNLQIHGKLFDKDNKINFGFGDEMDNHYKLIEEKDDNEYLKNIKSFQYLQNSNYKRLLDFIESKKFQVYVMGHSCGLSDRILLNTIFEHDNCKSIKVFYYENGTYNNYTEIIQNISRHFNKKKLMREKIVNKTLCQKLPQTKLPLKENGSQL